MRLFQYILKRFVWFSQTTLNRNCKISQTECVGCFFKVCLCWVRVTFFCATFNIFAPPHHCAVFSRHRISATGPHLRKKNLHLKKMGHSAVYLKKFSPKTNLLHMYTCLANLYIQYHVGGGGGKEVNGGGWWWWWCKIWFEHGPEYFIFAPLPLRYYFLHQRPRDMCHLF